MTAAPPIALYDTRAGYGRIEVLHGISLAAKRGEVTALLGPNGAGKTTALSVMSGLLAPWSGCRHVQGRHVNTAAADEMARIGVCHIREGRSVFPNLSVADNLAVASSTGKPVAHLRDIAFTMFPMLGERQAQLAGNLSGGERQMLALACGLGAEPAVLLIDELSMGLAPRVVETLYESVSNIAQMGLSVLVVDQFATIGLKYASTIHVMAHGVVTYSGTPSGAMEAVHVAYLGGAA